MHEQRKKYEEQIHGEMRALRETMADLVLEMHRERQNAPKDKAEETLTPHPSTSGRAALKPTRMTSSPPPTFVVE